MNRVQPSGSHPNRDCEVETDAKRHWAETVALAGALVVCYYFLPLDGRLWFVGVGLGAAVIVGIVPLGLRQTRLILMSSRPLSAAVRAITVLIVIVVLGFASSYYALDAHSPRQLVGIETKTDALYFTVVMLGTVGFGDITPTGQVARALTTINILFNLALVATTVRVVTWAAQRRVNERHDPR
jgi:voltage-gated potassium channel